MKELICITCPRGCHLKVDDNLNVTGNFCPRGAIYAKAELTHPARMITSSVATNSKMNPRLPVKTSAPIDKEKMMEVMKEIRKVTVNVPIKIGDVIIENVLGSGINVVATKNIKG